jgi:predicted amidohydrolase
MKLTVCELPDGGKQFASAWQRLANHVHAARSDLVLLPDMPFAPWFAGGREFDIGVWQSAVRAHEQWEPRLGELGATYVLSSRPVDFGNEPYDEAFVWDAEYGPRSVHAKAEFRNEQGAWENHWYRSTYPDFTPLELNGLRIGFLMGAELANETEAWRYGEEHVDVIAVPRGANTLPFDAWLERAKQLAQASHAYVMASTRSGPFGGQGCILSPAGEVLGVTSAADPCITRNVEFAKSGAQPVDIAALRDSLDPWETGVPPY